ncbi:hypothetical protein HKD37_06G015148 [Glycine soja]
MDTLFFGIKLRASLQGNNTIKRVFPRSKRCNVSAKHVRYPLRHAFRFCGQNVNLLKKHHVSASWSRLKCFREKEPPFSLSVSYFTPLWKEGVLLMRASVFTAVISGLCLLVWFGRNKARGFVETNILPSVCSVISEYVQRDVCFGKVLRISPLSVTLESCSFGPNEEEFSCGEAPTVKVRFRPLASLWRGKFVFDAVLSHPCVLVVQKKDFSWLGILPSQGGIQRRLSTKEGLDHRTRVRRVAREEAAAKYVRERDDAAREAAEMGYFVSEKNCGPSKGDDDLKEIATHSVGGTNSKSFFCMKEVEQHGHRCVGTGVDYDMKHADLEESFRVKFPEKGLKFWKRVIKGHRKHKFKPKAKRSDISASGIALRKRILERGAFAANAYFRSQSHGKFEQPLSSSGCFHARDHDRQLVKSDDKNDVSVASGDDNRNGDHRNGTQFRDLGVWSPSANENINGHSNDLNFCSDLHSQTRESKHENLQSSEDVAEHANANISTEKKEELGLHVAHSPIDVSATRGQRDLVSVKPSSLLAAYFHVPFETLIMKFGLNSFFRNIEGLKSFFLSGPIEKLKSEMGLKVEGTVSENVDGVDVLQSEDLTKILPVTLDSVQFRGATVMLLTYGDREVRVLENVNGHVKFHNHYDHINVKLSGNCKTWRSDDICEGDSWLSVDVFVDTVEQKWHANLKIDHFFVPLFERILDIPITWSKGRASGEVHLCMSKGETFPNHHGQLNVTGLNFQLSDAPSCFSNISGSLCFRGQSIFLHNACGWFGSIPLEASGDFGIHPEEGEFHLMCQVPSVEVNALMRTFNMRSLSFPLAGSITALFNCQGPLDTPIFVGTGMVSRTFSSLHVDTPTTVASEALAKSKEAGALAAFDRVPFSHVSANFTFNTDSCAENDETAIDANFSGSLAFEKIMLRYIPSYHHLMPLKFGVLSENTKLSGSLLRPPDESLVMDFVGPLQLSGESGLKSGQLVSISLHKGQLRANVDFQPCHSASLEVWHFPLDELELASLKGTIQWAEIQLNLRKRRGHGIISILRPKFNGVLGEALDVAARWSGDVITIEKTILEQSYSYYEMQGEYVLPGTRDHNPVDIKGDGFLKSFLSGHFGSVISSMGRWRMKLDIPRAEVAEMLPLARLLSRSMDPAVLSRSKLRREHHAPSNDVLDDLSLPGLLELKGRWHGSLNASGGGNGDTLAEFDFHGEDWEWGEYKTQRVLAVGTYSNDDGLNLEKFFIQKENATIHADGTLLGPKSNLHFAVLNFPVSLIPTVVQIIDSTSSNVAHSLRQLLAPIRGILHMEGDLRGSLAKPECDAQIRLLDGAIGGIVLERAEVVTSLTSTSHFLFNAKFEPLIQNGHVLVQGAIPVTFFQSNMLQQDVELDKSRTTWVPEWVKKKSMGTTDDARDKKVSRRRNEEGWNTQLAESLKGLNWQILDVREVRVDVDIKDGGMMLVTALTPYANWLHGSADIMLEARGTVDQPVLNGYASFRRASISSPVFRNSLTNFGGIVHMKSNRLSIPSLESRIGRKGKLLVKGNLPLRTKEPALNDKIEFKCEVLEVQAKNILSGQVNSQVQITGSILQPNISGNIKLSQGEVYLPHDKGGAASNGFPSYPSAVPRGGIDKSYASRYISQYFGSESASLMAKNSQSSGSVNESIQVEKDMEEVQIKPNIGIRLSDLKLVLGPELKIVYPFILNFSVSGELELNGLAHPKCIKPRGTLAFENGEVDLVATQVARRLDSQLAESILENNGHVAFEKVVTATLEKLMPRIEGKGEFGLAKWKLVYAPQIPSLVCSGATVDPFTLLAANLSFGTDVEVQLGKHIQARIVRQMKESQMAMEWTLTYELTSRLHLCLKNGSSKCILFEYSASQD